MKTFVWGIHAGVYALVLGAVTLEAAEAPLAFWKRHTIDASSKSAGKLGADGVRLADVNGDELLDVVTGWENGNAIRVCLNPGPASAKLTWPGVTVGRVKGAEDAVFADLNSDGAMDVVSCTEGKTRTVFVHWAPAAKDRYLDEGQWKTEEIPALKGGQMWMYCLPFDVNGDGKEDLIFGSKGAGATVGWLERPAEKPEDLGTWKYHKLYDAGWIMSIRAEDLDRDGDNDVIFSDRKGDTSGVWWLENKGKVGETPFASPQCLGLAGMEVMFLDIADINGDRRLDIAAAVRPDEIAFLIQPENPNSDPWEVQKQLGGVPQESFGTSKAVRVTDLDGDGKLDMVVTCENAKENLSGCFMVTLHTGSLRGMLFHRDISGSEGVKYDRIEVLDLDGDGDLDVMTCEERDNLGVFWYENPAH